MAITLSFDLGNPRPPAYPYRIAGKGFLWGDLFQSCRIGSKNPCSRESNIKSAKTRILQDIYEIGEIASRKKSDLLVVILPQAYEDDTGYHRDITEFCSSNGIHVLDLTASFLDMQGNGSSIYWPQDGHLTPLGYRILAEKIGSYILENRFIGEETT